MGGVLGLSERLSSIEHNGQCRFRALFRVLVNFLIYPVTPSNNNKKFRNTSSSDVTSSFDEGGDDRLLFLQVDINIS